MHLLHCRVFFSESKTDEQVLGFCSLLLVLVSFSYRSSFSNIFEMIGRRDIGLYMTVYNQNICLGLVSFYYLCYFPLPHILFYKNGIDYMYNSFRSPLSGNSFMNYVNKLYLIAFFAFKVLFLYSFNSRSVTLVFQTYSIYVYCSYIFIRCLSIQVQWLKCFFQMFHEQISLLFITSDPIAIIISIICSGVA